MRHRLTQLTARVALGANLWRLRELYRRYALKYLSIPAPGFALKDAQGTDLGAVTHVELRSDRVRVEGQAPADEVALVATGPGGELARRELRPDTGGIFVLELSGAAHRAHLHLELAPGGRDFPISLPSPGAERRARWRCRAGFTLALIRTLPFLALWGVTRNRRWRARAKQVLRLEQPVRGHLLQPAVLAGPAAPPALDPAAAVIVMPVYNAFEVLQQALAAAEAHTAPGTRLIVIEDGSSDARVRPWLRDWAADPARALAVELVENPRNLGFVDSVNRGFKAAGGAHVVLLNSDALVPPGWLPRLMAPILAEASVASVTPMSNDAEILSAPVICAAGPLAGDAAQAMDAVAAGLSAPAAWAELPTGVGFCMAMNARFLAPVGGFDTGFGRGYGEEVDWCQKARAAGGRHLGIGTLFVEHRGGQSFGTAEKAQIIAANSRIITRRYPDYDAEVQEFIAGDPLVTARLALGLAGAGAGGQPVPIYIAHSLGGGADLDLQRRIAAATEAGQAAVVLRVGTGMGAWQVELHTAAGMTAGATDDPDLVRALLAPITARRLIYSCAVGAADPLSVPALICDLAEGAQSQIEVLIHDYYMASPSYTLLGRDGHFHGLPTPATQDSAHDFRSETGEVVTLTDWQAGWGAMMRAAARITVFSDSSRVLITGVWPEVAPRISVTPHAHLHQIAPLPALAPDAPVVIGILGNIGLPKGAGVLQDLSRRIRTERAGIGLVILGNITTEVSLTGETRVHGDYHPREIAALAQDYGVSHWLIPSVLPETFSFTTREVLATGRPVFCFDLGAQADAVRAAENGHVLRARADQGAELLAELQALTGAGHG